MTQATPEQILSSLIKGINSQIENHIPAFNQACQDEAAEYNELVEIVDDRDREINTLQQLNVSLVKQRDNKNDEILQLKNGQAAVIKEAKRIHDVNSTVHNENNRLANELKELRALNPKKLKEQVKRLKESAKTADAREHKKDQEIKRLERKLLHAESEYSKVADKHNGAIDTMRKMHEMMLLEGAACEHQIQDETGGWFFIYRKPTTLDTHYNGSTADDPIVNREFFFEVQTDKGITFHVLSLESGEIGYPDCGLVVPDEVDEYCKAGYADGAPFTPCKPKAKVTDQTELDRLIAELENLQPC